MRTGLIASQPMHPMSEKNDTPADPLTPDVAQKVLQANLRNQVAKVAAGDTLPSSERAHFETAAIGAPTVEELARLKAARQSALIRKWATGGKLSREEMAEIQPILPPQILASPPVISADSPAAPPPSSRLKYDHDYAHYAAAIGVSERTIKRWAAAGKSVGEIFPFDAPGEALDWWSRHRKNTPPVELVNWVASTTAQPAATPSVSVVTPGASPAPSAPPASPFASPLVKPRTHSIGVDDMVEITPEDNYRRASRQHNANLTLLDKAFLDKNTGDAEIARIQRNVKISGDLLSTARRGYEEHRKLMGEMASIPEIKEDLRTILTSMAHSLVGMLEECGIPRERGTRAADNWFRQLRASRFFPDLSTVASLPQPPATESAPAPVPAA